MINIDFYLFIYLLSKKTKKFNKITRMPMASFPFSSCSSSSRSSMICCNWLDPVSIIKNSFNVSNVLFEIRNFKYSYIF